jgi:predicted SprT family Zn-dependent metalloprotease
MITTRNVTAVAFLYMHKYKLEGWSFGLDNAVRRAGQCDFAKKLITLSHHFVERNTDEEIVDTILHEIAHAIAGKEAGHGPLWAFVCGKIGAKPVACYDDSVNMPKPKYRAVCAVCGKKFYRHRRPRSMRICGADRQLLIFKKQ